MQLRLMAIRFERALGASPLPHEASWRVLSLPSYLYLHAAAPCR